MIRKVSKFVYLIVFIAVFSCENESTAEIVEELPAKSLQNESYGTDSEQQFDIYLPKARDFNTPVLILIHGGFWSAGDKSDLDPWINLLQPTWQNYAIVNTNYRLASVSNNQHPTQLNDIESLINYLDSVKGDYTISNNYFLVGVSAGAHLSLLYSYLKNTGNRVKAVCSIVGPTDFTDPYYTSPDSFFNTAGSLFLGATYIDQPDIYEEASPVSHVDSMDPPTLLFYGGQDVLVPPSQANRLTEKLFEANVYYEYTLFEEAGHNLANADLAFILGSMKTFFDSNN